VSASGEDYLLKCAAGFVHIRFRFEMSAALEKITGLFSMHTDFLKDGRRALEFLTTAGDLAVMAYSFTSSGLPKCLQNLGHGHKR